MGPSPGSHFVLATLSPQAGRGKSADHNKVMTAIGDLPLPYLPSHLGRHA